MFSSINIQWQNRRYDCGSGKPIKITDMLTGEVTEIRYEGGQKKEVKIRDDQTAEFPPTDSIVPITVAED